MHAKSAVDDQNDLYRTFESIVLTMLWHGEEIVSLRTLLEFHFQISVAFSSYLSPDNHINSSLKCTLLSIFHMHTVQENFDM